MSNNAKKIHWNTQKTPTKHVLRLFDEFLKIRFSAQKCGSQHRFRTMLKYPETLRKHQLNMFWGFLRNFWKSGSRFKNPVLVTLLKPVCAAAEKEHHENNHVVYCVRYNISKLTKIILIRGPELTMLGPPDTRLVPWLIMSGHRLLMSGPKLLRWKYGRGPEINMSGPRLIISGPLLVMSVPRDINVGAPTYYVGAPYLLFRGSEIIMLGPDSSCGDPDLLCLGTEIIMWEPRLCRGRYLSRRGPETIIWRTWIIMLGPR